MTLKRHTKQPDKKITDKKVDAVVKTDVSIARDEYTKEIKQQEPFVGTEVNQARDEKTVTPVLKDSSVSTEITSSTDERTSTPKLPDSSVSTELVISTDEDNVHKIATPIIVKTDVQLSSDERTTTPLLKEPIVSTEITSAQDEEKVARIAKPISVNTEIASAQDTERVSRVGKPVVVSLEVQQARDEKVVTGKIPEPIVSLEVQQAQDTERIAKITKPIVIPSDIVAAPDTIVKTSRLDKPIPNEIVVSSDETAQYKKFEDDFSGAWLPKGDPVRIGLKNYANIENMRPTDFGLEGVGGYSRINETGTNKNIKNAIQLRTNYDQESYIIAQGHSLSTDVPVLMTNKGTVPDTNDFGTLLWKIDNTNNVLALQSYYSGSYSGYVYLNITQTTYGGGSDLASEIEDKMNAPGVLNFTNNLVFTVTYSTTAKEFTIATAGGTCKYYEVANTAGAMIGFTETSSDYSASLVSDTTIVDEALYIEDDNDTDELARFSLLPNGHVGVCNSVENLIWAGDEIPIGAFLYGTEPTVTVAAANNNLEFTSNHSTATITIDNSTTYTGTLLAANIQTKIRADGTIDLSAATVEFRIGKFYIDAGEAGHTILFTGTGDAGYTVGFGAEVTVAAKTMLGKAPWVANPYFYNLSDNTEILNNTLTSTGNTFAISNAAANKYFLIGSTRPIKGMKITTTSGAFTTSTLSGKYFDGEKFVSLSSLAVSTTSSVDTVSFADTSSVAKPMFIDGYYLYFYRFELSTGSVTVSNITLNSDIQDLIDLWDGIYRICKKFIYIKYEDVKYNRKDFTLEVIEQTMRNYNYDCADEDLNLGGLVPIGANSGGTGLGLNEADEDYIEVLFNEPMCAFKWDLFRSDTGGYVDSMTVYFWDGTQYVKAQNVYDTIKNAEAGLSNYYMREQGGIQFFEIPLYNTDGTEYTGLEKQSEINGVKGYKYKILWTYDVARFLTLILDQFSGIPRYRTVKTLYKFPFMYKNRAMWFNSQSDKEYNRGDYSMANAPDVYNGDDASGANNERALYFGDNSALTSAVQLYGQYGNQIETVALVFKNNETYMLVGDDPETFKIYTVSESVGNVAPLSVVAAEVSFPSTNAPDQNIAMWISDKGPVIFLGNSIRSVPGLEPYFDPEDTLYLGTSYIKEARAWYDYMYKEYNIIIPTSTSASDNKWFVYDLVRQKWYQKVPTADYPSGAITVEDTDGNKYNYGYTSTGYMLKMEDDLYWGGSSTDTNKMQQKVKSADMILSGSLWEESTVRQLKLVHEDNDAGLITINHYINGNTAFIGGMVVEASAYYRCAVTHVGGTFADDLTAVLWVLLSYQETGAAWVTGTHYRAYPAETSMAEASNYRYKHLLHKLNVTGFSHAFEFIINNCTAKKPKLLGWSIEYDTQEDILDRSEKQS